MLYLVSLLSYSLYMLDFFDGISLSKKISGSQALSLRCMFQLPETHRNPNFECQVRGFEQTLVGIFESDNLDKNFS